MNVFKLQKQTRRAKRVETHLSRVAEWRETHPLTPEQEKTAKLPTAVLKHGLKIARARLGASIYYMGNFNIPIDGEPVTPHRDVHTRAPRLTFKQSVHRGMERKAALNELTAKLTPA